jgi:hypothetical protein
MTANPAAEPAVEPAEDQPAAAPEPRGARTAAGAGARPATASVPGPRPLLPLWAALIVSALGGLVYDLGFPGAGVWPFAFLGIAMAIVPLIAAAAQPAIAHARRL